MVSDAVPPRSHHNVRTHPDILITRPPKSVLRKKLTDKDAYRHLEPNGLPRIGAHVMPGEVSLGRVHRSFRKTGPEG